MISGFEKIVEERISKAIKDGMLDNLPGAGKPLQADEGASVPEDLRLAYKILKNADCLPPEIEAKREIRQTEALLSGMADTAQKYRLLKKLNFLILKINAMRNGSVLFDMPQRYSEKVVDRMASDPER
jgi:hypothetical protein